MSKFNILTLKGFTLIELMIVVAIIGILAVIGYPAYQAQIISSRRTDGQVALMNLAARLEIYYTENNTYVGANPITLGITPVSAQGFYRVDVTIATASSYSLAAIPIGAQTADTTCGALTLTNANVKGPNSVCWG